MDLWTYGPMDLWTYGPMDLWTISGNWETGKLGNWETGKIQEYTPAHTCAANYILRTKVGTRFIASARETGNKRGREVGRLVHQRTYALLYGPTAN